MISSPETESGRIEGIALIVADLEAAISFYCNALGFAIEARSPASATLRLGGVMLRLDQPPAPGRPYPAARAANDPWFQHFAIRVTDMDAAYAQLSAQPFIPISAGGPQQLPASSRSVIAFKFRDPDGHPLELTHFPGETTSGTEAPFLSVDHSAIAVADLETSIAFYRDRFGFRLDERLVNQGPTQWRLDGLDEAVVEIAVLMPPAAGPHFELLHYRTPEPAAPLPDVSPNDIAATRLLVGTTGGTGEVTADPDGHLIECV